MNIVRTTIAPLLSVAMVCLLASGATAQPQSGIAIEVVDSTNGQDTVTVGIEISDSEDFSNEQFNQEQFAAVFGTDDDQTQGELSRATNIWFSSQNNTVNGVSISQDELSGIINYWFTNL
jgi:parvulin-like peptidyl-prolyl isomerase